MEEIEAKFFIESKDEMRKRLADAGAKQVSDEFLMRRKIYERPGARVGDWIRVRQEHDKVTLTFKSKQAKTIDGMLETEVVVSDFDKCVSIIEETGVRFIAYQESYREVWKLDAVEIVIDTWPWLPTYIEVEGPTRESISETVTKLGLDMTQAHFGTPLDMYAAKYAVSVDEFNSISNIKFGETIPEILSSRKIAK